MNLQLISTIFSICLIGLMIPSSVNALTYGNVVENRFHNCMTAEPLGNGKYDYVPCDTPQNSIQNFNMQKSQTTPSQRGFVEGVNPNTIQGQPSELPPIVTHTEVQHTIMHEITSQPVVESQKAVTGNDEVWLIVLIFGIIVMSVIVLGLVLRPRRRPSPYYSSSYSSSLSNTRVERTTNFQSGQSIETEIQEDTSFRNWDETLWADVKKRFPRDWEKILKWIANNPEDVKVIVKNSNDSREALKKMAQKALDERDWSDLR